MVEPNGPIHRYYAERQPGFLPKCKRVGEGGSHVDKFTSIITDSDQPVACQSVGFAEVLPDKCSFSGFKHYESIVGLSLIHI